MPAQQIRVLHTLATLNPGGIETWLMHVLRHIDRSRFQFDFCLFRGRRGLYIEEAERLGSRVIPCPIWPHIWAAGLRFRRILREGKYDVVHSHVHHFSGALLRWAHTAGVSLRIAHSHNTHDGKSHTFIRRQYRKLMVSWIRRYATHTLAASHDAGIWIFPPPAERDGGSRVLSYGIDLTPFGEQVDEGKIRAELGILRNAPVVGHVGRFDPQKNHAFLLDVAAEVRRRGRDVHFLLIGDGPLRGEMEQKAVQMGLGGAVHFAGIRRDVPRLMKGAMDLFLFPSLWEGLGIVVVEAQSAGVPCVISDAVPEEAAFDPRLVHRLPLAESAGFWAEKVCSVLDAPLPQPPLPAEGNPFSIERCVTELSAIYESAREGSSRV